MPETLVFSPLPDSSEVSESSKLLESIDIVATPELTETIDISGAEFADEWQQLSIANEFQVLFFELAGLTFAIPLTDLGGIHKLDRSLNSLLGKPDWFAGVMTHNESLFNIVDTAKWVNPTLSSETLNYSHYVLLGSTEWGLSCEKLLGTETLTKEQIKWRSLQAEDLG
ncbi:chemotaxis protein CheW [Psychromonas sp. MME2]|uniref:chemotaxis protein CheW n=1 Tax=Psychromonas sp. MME2 TaxID=3231033 RepID=UPI00339D19CB